jgi:hypothetical protein
MKTVVEENPFNLVDLVVKPSAAAAGATAAAKGERRATPRSKEGFIQITLTQAARLAGASRPTTISVFFHLMFRSFRAYHKPFVLSNDALVYANISRHTQLRALRSLVKLGLISVERGGPRKPPTITIIGVTKQS